MYICCTAAATQIYSNVGGNLRHRHSAAVCAPQMQYIEIRDPERNEQYYKSILLLMKCLKNS